LKPLLASKRFDKKNWLLVFDNAKVHVSLEMITWMKANKVKFPMLPKYSPDLNIQERVWSSLANNVSRNGAPACVEELEKRIRAELARLNVLKLHQSLPRRMNAVIAAKGAILDGEWRKRHDAV